MQPEPEVDALSRSSTLKVTLSAAQQLAIVESPTGTGSAFPVEVPFVNKLGEPVEIMWYDNDGGQKHNCSKICQKSSKNILHSKSHTHF